MQHYILGWHILYTPLLILSIALLFAQSLRAQSHLARPFKHSGPISRARTRFFQMCDQYVQAENALLDQGLGDSLQEGGLQQIGVSGRRSNELAGFIVKLHDGRPVLIQAGHGADRAVGISEGKHRIPVLIQASWVGP